MNRKSVSRRSRLLQEPPIDDSISDAQRLDFEKIAEINPWKDIPKFDQQEAGQYQQVLTQINDMVLNDQKNKRRSNGKSRVSLTSKINNNNIENIEAESVNEETEETVTNDQNDNRKSVGKNRTSSILKINDNNVPQAESTRTRSTKYYKMHRWIGEFSFNNEFNNLQENSEIEKTNENIGDKNLEDEIEEIVDDEINERQSEGENQTSSISTINDKNVPRVESTRTKNTKNSKMHRWIGESNVNNELRNLQQNSEIEKTKKNIEDINLEDKIEEILFDENEKSDEETGTSSISKINDKNVRQVKSKRTKNTKNSKMHHCIGESNANNEVRNLQENSEIEKPTENIEDENLEEDSEEIMIRKKNKRQSEGEHETAEVESMRTKNPKNDKVQHLNGDSNVANVFVNVQENVTENSNTTKNIKQKNVEVITEELSLHDKKNKRKSGGRNRILLSSKMSNDAAKVKSTRKENSTADIIQQWLNEMSVNDQFVPENVGTEVSNENNNVKKKIIKEKKKGLKKSSKTINREQRKSIAKEFAETITTSKTDEAEFVEKQGIRKKNFWKWIPLVSEPPNTNIVENEDYNRHNRSSSLETVEESVIDGNSTIMNRDSIELSISPLRPMNQQSENLEEMDLPIDSIFLDIMQHESLISDIPSIQSNETLSNADTLKCDSNAENNSYALNEVNANSTMQSTITQRHLEKNLRNRNAGCIYNGTIFPDLVQNETQISNALSIENVETISTADTLIVESNSDFVSNTYVQETVAASSNMQLSEAKIIPDKNSRNRNAGCIYNGTIFLDLLQNETLISNDLSIENVETISTADTLIVESNSDFASNTYVQETVAASSNSQMSVAKIIPAQQLASKESTESTKVSVTYRNNMKTNDQEHRKMRKLSKAFEKFGKLFVKYSYKSEVDESSRDSESDSDETSSSDSSSCSCSSCRSSSCTDTASSSDTSTDSSSFSSSFTSSSDSFTDSSDSFDSFTDSSDSFDSFTDSFTSFTDNSDH